MTADEMHMAMNPLSLREELERGCVPVDYGISSQSILGKYLFGKHDN